MYTYCGGFPSDSVIKNPPANTGDMGSSPELGRSPGEGNGNPRQHSCLENSMDRGAWQALLRGVTKKSQTHLSDWTTIHTVEYIRKKNLEKKNWTCRSNPSSTISEKILCMTLSDLMIHCTRKEISLHQYGRTVFTPFSALHVRCLPLRVQINCLHRLLVWSVNTAFRCQQRQQGTPS